MSVSVHARGLMSPEDEEYKKHYEVVVFCNNKEVSVPKETVEFFKVALDDQDINDFRLGEILEKLSNGLPVDIKSEGDVMYGDGMFIDVADIPKSVKRIQIYCSV